jgi:predicted transglutaminase-like cysteine proteinase
MTLEQVNSTFVYKTDEEKYGIKEYWDELDGGEGDCESYSITLKRHVKEFKYYTYWYCKLGGAGHCVLVDSSEQYIIDNNTQKVLSILDYKKAYDVTNLKPYKSYELVWKFTSAFFIKQYFKLTNKL